jgi:hypothetical protein
MEYYLYSRLAGPEEEPRVSKGVDEASGLPAGLGNSHADAFDA